MRSNRIIRRVRQFSQFRPGLEWEQGGNLKEGRGEPIVVMPLLKALLVRRKQLPQVTGAGNLCKRPGSCFTLKKVPSLQQS